MGLSATTFRIMYLTNYQAQLESQLQTITENKMALTDTAEQMTCLGQDMSPNSDAVRLLMQRKQRLNAIDKQLDMQIQSISSKLQMVQTELASAKKLQSEQIKSSFSY